MLSGCSHTSEIMKTDHSERGVSDYEVIFYIHADSDYLFHDPSGNAIRDNKHKQLQAIKLAENAESGEYFIYIQNPERKRLGLFPVKNSHLYHYRNGFLKNLVKYRHIDKKEGFLSTEADLYYAVRSNSAGVVNQKYMLYFGHEIPDGTGVKYHTTLPGIQVNTISFAAGIQNLLVNDHQKFDLVVLSTCNNGNPAMVSNLLPFTRILLASPQNLHLSHIDSETLGLLESSPGVNPHELALSMADQTFNRLQSEVQTAITLTVYDLEILSVHESEIQAFTSEYYRSDQLNIYSENIDCKSVSYFDSTIFDSGIHTWFKPTRFGRFSSMSIHTGWGCKPLININ
jgi:hypothetical protein